MKSNFNYAFGVGLLGLLSTVSIASEHSEVCASEPCKQVGCNESPCEPEIPKEEIDLVLTATSKICENVKLTKRGDFWFVTMPKVVNTKTDGEDYFSCDVHTSFEIPEGYALNGSIDVFSKTFFNQRSKKEEANHILYVAIDSESVKTYSRIAKDYGASTILAKSPKLEVSACDQARSIDLVLSQTGEVLSPISTKVDGTLYSKILKVKIPELQPCNID